MLNNNPINDVDILTKTGTEQGKVKPLMLQSSEILSHFFFSFTVIPPFKQMQQVCRKSSSGEGRRSLGRCQREAESANGKTRPPVAVGAPQPQQQQQDEPHHADSHHGDLPLPPLASVAQFPRQVSVLTSLPDVAKDTAVTTHKQRSALSPGQECLYIFRFYILLSFNLCVSRLSSLEAYGKSIRGQLKAL